MPLVVSLERCMSLALLVRRVVAGLAAHTAFLRAVGLPLVSLSFVGHVVDEEEGEE